MSGKEFTFWQLYREFQRELEQLKQDIERVNAVRDELEEYKRKQG